MQCGNMMALSRREPLCLSAPVPWSQQALNHTEATFWWRVRTLSPEGTMMSIAVTDCQVKEDEFHGGLQTVGANRSKVGTSPKKSKLPDDLDRSTHQRAWEPGSSGVSDYIRESDPYWSSWTSWSQRQVVRVNTARMCCGDATETMQIVIWEENIGSL